MSPQLTRRGLLGAAIAVVLVAAGMTLTVPAKGKARWSEAQSWIEDQESAWSARDSHRPALWGESSPGDAFARYAEAAEVAQALLRQPREQSRLIALVDRPETLSYASAGAVRGRWAPAVRAMRAGAHCEDVRPPARFEDGSAARSASLVTTRWIVEMACVEARELAAAGRGREAVELTLDAATFGADLLRSPLLVDQMVGIALVAIATSEAWTDTRLEQLDPRSLELLAIGLERLDRLLPVELSLRGEALRLAYSLAAADGPEKLGLPVVAAWNFGFSMRWMAADAVLEFAGALDRLDRSAELRWPERARVIRELQDELSRSGNAVVRSSWVNLSNAEHRLREVVAQLRMLRIAVDARIGRSPTALEDPLGAGALEVVRTDGGLRILSGGAHSDERLERAVAHPSPR